MALSDGQVQVRDLVMGPGTPYRVLGEFNPWNRQVRADQTDSRAWDHGSWSGVEWMQEAVVPLRILIEETDTSAWLSARDEMMRAFRPVGEATADVELRFHIGGREFVMFGRPRMVEPDVELIGIGKSFMQASFVALDPFIYGDEQSYTGIGLPQFEGGLTVPLTVPFTIGATLADGFVDITNDGTAESDMFVRIDGPAVEPSITLQRGDGEIQTLRFDFTVRAGHWLEVDTAARTVMLNGRTNRRSRTTGDFPQVPPGTHRLRWLAGNYDEQAEMSVTVRSAWW